MMNCTMYRNDFNKRIDPDRLPNSAIQRIRDSYPELSYISGQLDGVAKDMRNNAENDYSKSRLNESLTKLEVIVDDIRAEMDELEIARQSVSAE
ncbi:hypothetical protein NXG27_01065 [Megasphaera paucivorans]|uniref:Uncharacterized protein n=1 Tax=Megasphaera paucivorans TaxID=349095 RepID=A0A1G9QEU2_9FIRM|nr:hypothetical protein [Megasphaera paucivorans]SDM09493.1 hypothetical protein SAMN05660299_00214 [Megasphaera paucivorans]